MSFGDPNLHDPPYTSEMDDARKTVKSACDKAGLVFLCSWHDESMTEEQRIRHVISNEGARIVHTSSQEIANTIRVEMNRDMAW
jgi:hypothetical protein